MNLLGKFTIKSLMHIYSEVSLYCCLLMSNDIVLVVETMKGITTRLERLREALESKGCRLRTTKKMNVWNVILAKI